MLLTILIISNLALCGKELVLEQIISSGKNIQHSLICPNNYTISKCYWNGTVVQFYTEGNICTGIGGSTSNYSMHLECLPILTTSSKTFEKLVDKQDSILCPAGYTISDCRTEYDFDKFKVKAGINECTMIPDKPKHYNKIIFQAICIKNATKIINNKVIEDHNGEYSAAGVCPKDSLMYDCECVDEKDCASVEIFKNKCIVKYLNNNPNVMGKTYCTENPDLIFVKKKQTFAAYENLLTSCLIKIGPKSTETFKQIKDRIQNPGTSQCNINPPCNDCEITPISIIPKTLTFVEIPKTSGTCPKDRILTHCHSLHSSSKFLNKSCVSNFEKSGTFDTQTAVSCDKGSCFYNIIYRRFVSFAGTKIYGGECKSGETLLDCMIENITMSSSKFSFENNKCKIIGKNLDIIAVCKKDNYLKIQSDVLFFPKHNLSNKVSVSCPKNFHIENCDPVYSGYSYIEKGTCFAYASNDKAFVQAEAICVADDINKSVTLKPANNNDQFFSDIKTVVGGKGGTSVASCSPGYQIISCQCSKSLGCFGSKIVEKNCYVSSADDDISAVLKCGKLKQPKNKVEVVKVKTPYQKIKNELYKENKTILSCSYLSWCNHLNNWNHPVLKNNRCEFSDEPKTNGELTYFLLTH